MTARTFGRKGIAAAAPSRRAAFVAPEPAALDEAALRRAAFVAGERARAERPAQGEALPPAPIDYPHKSLALTYVLWLFMGAIGAHRFYLGRPFTAGLMVSIWATSWALVLREYYPAFAGVSLIGWWVFIDGFLIRRLHRIATTGQA
ncbi:MAG TPA: TM2 domain-containing protein [Allosphingosinicella sp.]|nr:TM2 domain-containing protein [Allosphingosinicella sp.]